MKRVLTFAFFAMLPACGAILDLPDTKEDDNFGKVDSGYYADGAKIPDDGSSGGDGTTGGDGSSAGDGSVTDGGGGDGSVVLCGGKDCHGGECIANVCQPATLTSTIVDPQKLAADGHYVFVINGVDKIERVDIDNGTTTNMVSGESTISGIFATGGYVYFTRTGSSTNSSVSRCSASGCSTERIDYLSGSARAPVGIAATASAVIWSYDDATGGIVHCDNTVPGCSTSTTATTKNVPLIRLEGNGLYWTGGTNASFPGGVYECSDFNASCGAGAHALASTSTVVTFAVDSTNVYYLESSSIFVQAIGSDVTPAQAALTGSNPLAVGVDATDIYYLMKNDGTSGAIERCAITGNCPASSQIGQTIPDARDMIVYGDSLYYASSGTDHKVYRLTK